MVSPAPAMTDPYAGRVVNGKFRVEALIGQGGMGRVYRAHHLTLDRPVALKVLHAQLSGDPSVARRFHREAKAASRLNHPNSISVLDFGQVEDGSLFMVMEFLDGKDLARLIEEESPLGEERIVRIGEQILSALAEAHAQGVVHRDLKPENVIVEQRRRHPDFVKVLDFGIAQISEPEQGGARFTQAGQICGTPAYLSPEQAQGHEVDARTDLYSLGVMLYQMVTGELPFRSQTSAGYLTKHLTEVPVAPHRRRADLVISPRLDALIVRALSKNPAERWASAEEMRSDLLACLEPSRPAAAPAPTADAVFDVDLALGGGPPTVTEASENELVLDEEAAGRGASGVGRVLVKTPARWRGPLAVAVLVVAVAAGAWIFRDRLVGTPEPQPTGRWVIDRNGTAVWTPDAQPASTGKSGAVRRDRTRALATLEKAEARRTQRDFDGAVQLFLAAEELDPSLPQIQKGLAHCYQSQGKNRMAVERYQRYLASNPGDAAEVRTLMEALR